MVPGTVGRFALIVGVALSVGGVGCFLTKEDVGSTNDQVTAGGDTSAVLKSTLILDGGCTAAKVGPRHLLVAARCVAGKAAFETGKTINFKAASELRNTIISNDDGEMLDAGSSTSTSKKDAAVLDAGNGEEESSDASVKDAGKSDAGSKPLNGRQATIAEVSIHASYAAKCKDDVCAFGALAASDAKDIAVITLEADLDSVPTVPVDLDSVGQADPVLVVGSGCMTFDASPKTPRTFETIAVPAKSVNHVGSPYIEQPALVTRLNSAYVVTPGVGWRSKEPAVCKGDIGAPLFRADKAAVAGVTSNFTAYDTAKNTPVTLHHTRVDTISKVGPWLESLGVETTHSCSESTTGCTKHDYDGGVPSPSTKTDGDGTTGPGDAGADAKAQKSDAGEIEGDGGTEPPSKDLPSQGEEAPLPTSSSDDEATPSGSGADEDYDAGPKKKKKATDSGCSAAPGSASGSNGMFVGLGLVLAAAASRRRRAAKK